MTTIVLNNNTATAEATPISADFSTVYIKVALFVAIITLVNAFAML